MSAAPVAGLDVFLERAPSRERIGWLANAGAVERRTLRFGPEAALARGHDVVRLFAPEHGLHGVEQAGAAVAHGRDPVTGLPVRSLYGGGHDGDARLLDGLDLLVVDLLDLGARYGTYVATAARLLEQAAAERPGVRVLVLDRPNPLGRVVEGPALEPGFESLVGLGPLPIRHGLTLAEILRWHVRRSRLQVALEVAPVRDWDARGVSPPEPFVPPSPSLNVFEAQLLYPGTCLFEGTNVSEGRGTATPFQLFGAPWLDAGRLLARLAGELPPAVAPRRVYFRPQFSKHAGDVCEGLFVHVLDRERLRPVALACRLLHAIFAEFPEAELLPARPRGRRFLDLLWGSSELGDRLEERAPVPEGEAPVAFHASIAGDLLYEPA